MKISVAVVSSLKKAQAVGNRPFPEANQQNGRGTYHLWCIEINAISYRFPSFLDVFYHKILVCNQNIYFKQLLLKS